MDYTEKMAANDKVMNGGRQVALALIGLMPGGSLGSAVIGQFWSEETAGINWENVFEKFGGIVGEQIEKNQLEISKNKLATLIKDNKNYLARKNHNKSTKKDLTQQIKSLMDILKYDILPYVEIDTTSDKAFGRYANYILGKNLLLAFKQELAQVDPDNENPDESIEWTFCRKEAHDSAKTLLEILSKNRSLDEINENVIYKRLSQIYRVKIYGHLWGVKDEFDGEQRDVRKMPRLEKAIEYLSPGNRLLGDKLSSESTILKEWNKDDKLRDENKAFEAEYWDFALEKVMGLIDYLEQIFDAWCSLAVQRKIGKEPIIWSHLSSKELEEEKKKMKTEEEKELWDAVTVIREEWKNKIGIREEGKNYARNLLDPRYSSYKKYQTLRVNITNKFSQNDHWERFNNEYIVEKFHYRKWY